MGVHEIWRAGWIRMSKQRSMPFMPVTERRAKQSCFPKAVYEVVRQLRRAGDYGNQLHEPPASDVLDNLSDCASLVDACEMLIGELGIFVASV